MPELYLVLEARDMLRLGHLLDGVLGHQDLVDTLHRGQALGDVVACLRELFQRIDNRVEHHHVIDEDRSGERVVVQYQHTAEPQHDDNHHRPQELTHGVGHRLTYVHPCDVVAVCRVDLVEAAVHLLLGTESLDDAEAAQCLLHLTHRVAPESLSLHTLGLQLTTYPAHEPTHDGHDDQRKHRQLPRDKQQHGEVADDEDGVLEEHL